MNKTILIACCFIALQSTAQNITISKNIQNAMNRIDTNTIRSHIAYLADDKLKGRLPGTEGYQMAVDYVIDQFKKIGVKPGGDNGGFTQKLLIRKSVVDNKSCFAILNDKNGNNDSLAFGYNFIVLPHPLKERAFAEGQLVFAGYGLDIPGVYSDYNGVDVKNKIVVVIAGAPDGFSSTISAHLNNIGNKANIASGKGAVGMILVTVTGGALTASTNTIQSNVALSPDKTVAYSSGFRGNLPIMLRATKGFLFRLFMNSGKNVEQVLNDIKNKKTSSFDLPFTLSVGYSTAHTDYESYNVVGLIPGSDEKLKNEYVVHSAHLDHVGIGRAVNGDSIYNGAHDNASGVSSLLEIARVYTSSNAKPKRSILIVMMTGEEMGLLGSNYFASNPTVPKSSIVADVNTDMPTVIAPLLSVVPLGADHSTLMNNVQFAANYLGLGIEEDPEPTENRFVRSDQYSFVQNGIPALHIKYGNKSNIPGFNLVDFVKQWRAKYYHQAADDINGIFNFAAAKRMCN